MRRSTDLATLGLRLVMIVAAVLMLASYTAYKTRRGDWGIFWQQSRISGIAHEAGHAYRGHTGRPDLGADERGSPAQVLEYGKILGPSNRPQSEVAAQGAGRFIFLKDAVYFSASDNSNPATNGRSYTFFYPRVARTTSRQLYAVTSVMLVLTAALTVFYLRSRGWPSLLRACGVEFMRTRSPAVLTPPGLRIVGTLAGALALTWLVGILVDPLYVIEPTTARVALLSASTLVFAAGYYAAESFRSRHPPIGALVRVASLFAIAALAWLRPGVSSENLGGTVTPLLFVLLLATGMALHVVIPPATRDRVTRFWRGPGHESVSVLLTVTAVAAALMAAPSLVRYWDQSGWMDSRGYDAYAMNILTGKAPEGSSAYMPVYQYGLALIYYVFGHFFFVQQVVNLVLTVAGIAALAYAAWILFDSVSAAVIAGVIAVFCRQFYYAVHFTQIESWYVPFICFLLLAWARYWRDPSWVRLAWLAAAIALGLNTRNQGAVFFAFMCAAPLWVPGLAWRRRVQQLALMGVLVAASLTPWTLRNYVVDGRLSPSGSRSAAYIGVQNDRRIGLYGLRYWEGWNSVVAEFEERYPDPADRERAFLRAGWTNVVGDPGWLGRALFWRTAAFYGLLPDGMYDPTRIIPTDWATEWRRYVFWRTTPLLLLPLALLGILFRPDRTSVFLAGAIASNLVILVFSASPEDRISYPVLTMHILLASGVFAPRALPAATVVAAARHTWNPRWLVAGLSLCLFLVTCRCAIGSRYTYRPLMERGVAVVPAAAVDLSLPTLNDYPAPTDPSGLAPQLGQRVRFRSMVSNYMVPPKFAGAVPWLPLFVTEPLRETFYYAYLLFPRDPKNNIEWVGVSFQGAQLSEGIREGDAVDIEGVVVHIPTATALGYFVRAQVVRKLPIHVSELPGFP